MIDLHPKKVIAILLIGLQCLLPVLVMGQNVGLGIAAPVGKMHIKGSANVSQLVIDANSTQTNVNPLIRLRNTTGTDLLWIHSDEISNTFIGLNSGRINNTLLGAINNTFIGSSAGFTNTSGFGNSGIGYNALRANETGTLNTAIGSGALSSNVIGSYNTALGNSALGRNIAGSNATAIGYEAMRNAVHAPTNETDNYSLGYAPSLFPL